MIFAKDKLKALLTDDSVLSEENLKQALIDILPENIFLGFVDLPATKALILNSSASAESQHLKIKPHPPEYQNAFFHYTDNWPYQLEPHQIEMFFENSDGINVWLLPYLHKDAKKTMMLVDTSLSKQQDQIESVFFLLNWLFTQAGLRETQEKLASLNKWVEDELADISRLQHLLLPDKFLTIPGLKVAYHYHAMEGAGGDYLDVMDLSKDRNSEAHDFGAIVADVAGHGPGAAMEVAMLDAILRTFKPTDETKGPAEVLEYINQHFFTKKARGRFLTANVFRYLAETKTLFYANAGHPHGYIKRGQDILPLKEGGIPIGVIRENGWESYPFVVEQGDILFIYTDVIIETRDDLGNEFGFSRLEQALKEAPGESAALIEFIENAVRYFGQCRTFEDDMTLCAIQFN